MKDFKKKKYLWLKVDSDLKELMNSHEMVLTGLTVANWHEAEYLDEYVRVTIDWGKSGDRQQFIEEEGL